MKTKLKKFGAWLMAMSLAFAGAGAYGATQVANQTELNDAVKNAAAGDVIEITAAGTYTMPGISANITIKGVDGVVFNCVGSGSICSIPNGARFVDVSFSMGQSSYHGWQHPGALEFEGCTFDGLFFSYGRMTFNNCTFIQTTGEYNMWCYAGNIVYSGCTFDSQGKFLNIYNEGNGEWSVKCEDCLFISGKANKAALNVKDTCGKIELPFCVTINNCRTQGSFPAAADLSGRLLVLDPLVQVDDIKEVPSEKIVKEQNNLNITMDGELIYPVLPQTNVKVDTKDVEVKDASGKVITDEKATAAVQAIAAEMKALDVANTDTGLNEAVKKESESDVNFLAISLKGVQVAKDTGLSTVTYEVKPMVKTTVVTAEGKKTTTEKIANEKIEKPVSFVLPVASFQGTQALVSHFGDDGALVEGYVTEVKGSGDSKFVELASQQFSTFVVADAIKIADGFYKNQAGTEFYIMDLAGLNNFRNLASGDGFGGKTVKLMADITFEGTWDSGIGGTFGGTFDGQGKTIKNLKVSGTANGVGLFGGVFGATIKNLALKNPVVVTTGENYAGAIAGNGYAHIENCTVTGGSVTGNDQVGGIIGYLSCGYVKGCTVDGVAITANGDRAGGIAGKANVDSQYQIIGNTVKDCTIVATKKIDGFASAAGVVGQIMAGANNAWSITDNNVVNTTTKTDGDDTFVPVGEFRSGSYQADAVTAGHIARNHWEPATESDSYTLKNPKNAEESVTIENFYPAAKIAGSYMTYETIQAAVDAADISNGPVTILVMAGEHEETVYLNRNNLKFGQDANNKGVYGKVTFRAAEGADVTLNGHFDGGNGAGSFSDIKISGLTINSAGTDSHGLYLEFSEFARNIEVSDCEITATGWGVYINGPSTSNLKVQNCTINGAAQWGVSLGGINNQHSDIAVIGNTFQNGSYGPAFFGAVENASVKGNTFSGCKYALWLNNGSGIEKLQTPIAYADNTVVGEGDCAIAMRNLHSVDVAIGEGNTYNGEDIYSWGDPKDGVIVSKSGYSVYFDHKLYYSGETAFKSLAEAVAAFPRGTRLTIANYDASMEVPAGYTIAQNDDGSYVIFQNFYQDATDENLWHVANLAGLKEFRDAINESKTSFANKTIQIDDDIDMSQDGYWTAIKAYPGSYLSGATIDGQGHKIIGMKIVTPDPVTSYAYGGGFIDKTAGKITIRDLAFEGADVMSVNGSQVGIVVGMSYDDVTMDNVDLKDCVVTGTTKTGLYVGQNDSGTVTLKNCDVVNSQTKANYSAALLIGLLNANSNGAVLEDNTVDEASKFCWIEGEYEKGEKINGRYYYVKEADAKLSVSDPGEKCLAEQRIAGAQIRYKGKVYTTVWGSKFYPELDFEAENFGMKYETVAAAADEAIAGDTIMLLRAASGEATLPNGVTFNTNDNEWTGTLKAEDGSFIRDNGDGTFTAVTAIAEIGGQGYESLADAVAAVTEGQTIKMLANETLTKELSIGADKSFTLDLNGKTIKNVETGFEFTRTNVALWNGVPKNFMIIVEGKVTICDSSEGKAGEITASNYGDTYYRNKALLIIKDGMVTLESGKVYGEYTGCYLVGDTTLPQDQTPVIPTLVVNGGELAGGDYGVAIKGATAELAVNGGKVTAATWGAISTNGTQDWYNGGNCKVTVNGGLVECPKSCAIYNPAESVVKITGGTLKGASGIVVKGGKIEISGDAELIAYGAKHTAEESVAGDASDTGDAIYIEDDYAGHKPIVSVIGGTLKSANAHAVQYWTDKNESAADLGGLSIAGGTLIAAKDELAVLVGGSAGPTNFIEPEMDGETETGFPLCSSRIPAEYIAVGYVEKDNKNGTWTVTKGANGSAEVQTKDNSGEPEVKPQEGSLEPTPEETTEAKEQAAEIKENIVKAMTDPEVTEATGTGIKETIRGEDGKLKTDIVELANDALEEKGLEPTITAESKNVDSHVEIQLESVEVSAKVEMDTQEQRVVKTELNKVIYDIKPILTIVTTVGDVKITTRKEIPTNTPLDPPISFRLWLDESFKYDVASVVHKHGETEDPAVTRVVKTEKGRKYIELTWSTFSEAIITGSMSSEFACQIGDTPYETVTAALAGAADNAVVYLLKDCEEENLTLKADQKIVKNGYAVTHTVGVPAGKESVTTKNGEIYAAEPKIDVPVGTQGNGVPIRGFNFAGIVLPEPGEGETIKDVQARYLAETSDNGNFRWQNYVLFGSDSVTASKLTPQIVKAATNFSIVTIKAQDGYEITTPAKCGVGVKFQLMRSDASATTGYVLVGEPKDEPVFQVDVKEIGVKTYWKIQTIFETTEDLPTQAPTTAN